MEVGTEEKPVTETDAGLDTDEEERNRKKEEYYVKKKAKTKEKATGEKKKKDDVKKLVDGTSSAVAKESGPGAKRLVMIKEQLQKKQEEEERLRKEEEERIQREEEEAELERIEKLMKEKEKKKHTCCTYIVSVIVATIVIFACNYDNISQRINRQSINDRNLQRLLIWEKSFSDMIAKYGSALPNSSQKVIYKSVRRVLNRITPSKKYDNNEPSVVLLVGSTHNAKAVRCVLLTLSRSLAEIFQENQSPIIKAEQLSHLDLTKELHKVLGHSKLHTVALDGIERLQGNSALSLHPFTDHDKAVYLDVIILLTAYTNNQLTNTSIQVEQIDQIANSLLEISWGKILPQEQVAGLLSRITPSVAIVSDTIESQNWNCD